MIRNGRRRLLRRGGLLLLTVCLVSLPQTMRAAEPPVVIQLGPRHGHCTPERSGYTHTGGGNISVSQPTPDVLVVTMSGAVVATGHPCRDSLAALQFDLTQELRLVVNNPKVQKCKLEMEATVIGLLRAEEHPHGGHSSGCATQDAACASLGSGSNTLLSLCVEPHSVGPGEHLSLNCHAGPQAVVVPAGDYTLHQTFRIQAAHARQLLPCKPASAEFAPDPALDPLWISAREPFHGCAKKDFGFSVTLRVSPE
jgi:hypothetical protein